MDNLRGRRKEKHFASFGDILGLCAKDWPLILVAFIALLLAAMSQVCFTYRDRKGAVSDEVHIIPCGNALRASLDELR